MDQKLKGMLGAAFALLCALSFSSPARGQLKLPEDRGKEEFVHNCTACHRAELVVAARKTPEDWRKSVDEMASRGTDGTKEDLDNVYIYLVKYWALDESAPHPATPPSTPNASAKQNLSLVDHVGTLGKPRIVRASVVRPHPVQNPVRYFLSQPPLS